MDTVHPSRRQKERQRHRDEILDAALRVLTDRGMDGLTIEAVAREAEFAVGSLYRHFPSKEELVDSLYVHLTEPMFQQIESVASAEGSFEDRLERWVASGLNHAKGEIPLLKLLFTSSGTRAPMSNDRLRNTRDRYLRGIDALVASGQEQGVVAKGERLPMDLCLFGMVSGFMRATMWDDHPPVRKIPEIVRRAFLEGFGERDLVPMGRERRSRAARGRRSR
jgi:AcrR family transcriptional regulator